MKRIYKILDYILIACLFFLGGEAFAGFAIAGTYGVQFKSEFAFMPEWTASPIAMLIYGIIPVVLGFILIYNHVSISKKEES